MTIFPRVTMLLYPGSHVFYQLSDINAELRSDGLQFFWCI